MYLNWNPTRELVGAGSNGKIEIDLQLHDRKPKVIGTKQKSLFGNSESVLHRIEFFTTLKTVPTDDISLQPKFREFMASVAAGETFTLDAMGTEASPVDPITVTMVDNSYVENREAVIHFSYSFQIEE